VQNLSIAEIISRILVVLIAMDVHEFAHAYVANRMGDSTARDMGRMTLDPRANINWVGFAMFVFIGFGILGSAPVNESRMRDRRWGMFAAVLAGPVSNLLLAMVFAIPFWLGLAHIDVAAPRQFAPTLNLLLTDAVEFNLILFVFNLLPMYPLDGWTIVGKLLPADLRYQWERYKQYSSYAFWGLLLLSFIGFNAFYYIVGQPINFLENLFLRPILHLGGF
jgi:Zn-dependent protease